MKRRWRVVLLRSKGEILGEVEASDVAAAKAAAAVQFGLDEIQRTRIIVQEYGRATALSLQRTAPKPTRALRGGRGRWIVSRWSEAISSQPAANRALAGENRTPRFRFITSRRQRLRVLPEKLTGNLVELRRLALAAEIAVVVHPPSTSRNIDVAALFKTHHFVKGRWYTVYDHIRYATISIIEYIVLCRGRLDCEAQNNRSCQTSACNKGGHDRVLLVRFLLRSETGRAEAISV
jgi:hypothetical protein